MKENVLLEKPYQFALRVVGLCRYLNDEKREYVLSKQILVAGTSIGSQIEEAQQGENRPDFLHQLSIANKHAFKTNYRRRLLRDSEYLNEKQFSSLLADCEELQKILTSTVKTTKKR
ncbi:MAG TPA: four helix bundle protein [Pyrinomonadaceae bacterium]|jgi:four helix bundle protein